MTDGEVAVELDAVAKRYGRAGAAVTALDAVTLAFRRGRFTAVMGLSGSGKSNLPARRGAASRGGWQSTPMIKGQQSAHPPPFSMYSARRGLLQDPGHAA